MNSIRIIIIVCVILFYEFICNLQFANCKIVILQACNTVYSLDYVPGVGFNKHILAIRSGRRTAICAAKCPPTELPTKCTCTFRGGGGTLILLLVSLLLLLLPSLLFSVSVSSCRQEEEGRIIVSIKSIICSHHLYSSI